MECGEFCKELGVACIWYLKLDTTLIKMLFPIRRLLLLLVKKRGQGWKAKAGERLTQEDVNELEML